ncbi:hypothetical protein O9992_28220 [Vibrio lentus]|nr:hypothetical protein [Vibrio lentus]
MVWVFAVPVKSVYYDKLEVTRTHNNGAAIDRAESRQLSQEKRVKWNESQTNNVLNVGEAGHQNVSVSFYHCEPASDYRCASCRHIVGASASYSRNDAAAASRVLLTRCQREKCC